MKNVARVGHVEFRRGDRYVEQAQKILVGCQVPPKAKLLRTDVAPHYAYREDLQCYEVAVHSDLLFEDSNPITVALRLVQTRQLEFHATRTRRNTAAVTVLGNSFLSDFHAGNATYHQLFPTTAS